MKPNNSWWITTVEPKGLLVEHLKRLKQQEELFMTPTQRQHTKTPWEYYVNMVRASTETVNRGRDHKMKVPIADCTNCSDIDGQANARHIVHCVNRHGQLVEALTEALAFYYQVKDDLPYGVSAEIGQRMKQALATAQKEG